MPHILNIYDLTGKLMETQSFTDGKVKVDVSKFNTGLYLYSVTDNNKNTLKSGKFNVAH
jgi:hypothetical protein